MKSTNIQTPSSREIPNIKRQSLRGMFGLEFGSWSFSGAWMLALGAFAREIVPTMNHEIISPLHPNAPASELSRIAGSTAAIRAMGKKTKESAKFQAPSPREHPNLKHQVARSGLEVGSWCFSGAWMSALGAFPRGTFAHEPASQSLNLK